MLFFFLVMVAARIVMDECLYIVLLNGSANVSG